MPHRKYVLKKKSRVHGSGIFAKAFIAKGTRIIEYVGERITKSESDRRGSMLIDQAKNSDAGAVYIFELNKKYDIDGNVHYNTAKYINHSCDPNCETEIIAGHIWVIALRNIQKGEELSYNYGYDLDTFREHVCRCNSPRCVGYIVAEAQWPKLKRILNGNKTHSRRRR